LFEESPDLGTAFRVQLPLVVLQAGEKSDGTMSSDEGSAHFQVRAELLGSVAGQSKQGELVVVPNSPHEIHLY
jgi:hypothetical protein